MSNLSNYQAMPQDKPTHSSANSEARTLRSSLKGGRQNQNDLHTNNPGLNHNSAPQYTPYGNAPAGFGNSSQTSASGPMPNTSLVPRALTTIEGSANDNNSGHYSDNNGLNHSGSNQSQAAAREPPSFKPLSQNGGVRSAAHTPNLNQGGNSSSNSDERHSHSRENRALNYPTNGNISSSSSHAGELTTKSQSGLRAATGRNSMTRIVG